MAISVFSKGISKKPIFHSHCSTAQDRTISISARGLLFYYLSMSDSWVHHPKKIQFDTGLGRDKFRDLNKELMDAGYLICWQEKKVGGRWGNYHYEAFYDKNDAAERKLELEKTPSYEQRMSSGKNSKNDSTDNFQRAPENTADGKSVPLIVKKEENLTSLDKKEDPLGSQVRNASRSKLSEPRIDAPLLKVDKKEPCYPIPPSKSSREKAKEDRLDENESIQKLYRRFEFDQVDEWLELVDWKDLYYIAAETFKRIERGMLSNSKTKVYVSSSIKKRVDNYISTMTKAGKL